MFFLEQLKWQVQNQLVLTQQWFWWVNCQWIYHMDEIFPEMHVGMFKGRALGAKHIPSFSKTHVFAKIIWCTFFFLLIQNLAYFKDKEFLIFSRHLYSLFLYEHFPYHLQRENVQLQKLGAYPHPQVYKQSSRLGKRDTEIHFQWSGWCWATLFNSSSPQLLWYFSLATPSYWFIWSLGSSLFSRTAIKPSFPNPTMETITEFWI